MLLQVRISKPDIRSLAAFLTSLGETRLRELAYGSSPHVEQLTVSERQAYGSSSLTLPTVSLAVLRQVDPKSQWLWTNHTVTFLVRSLLIESAKNATSDDEVEVSSHRRDPLHFGPSRCEWFRQLR